MATVTGVTAEKVLAIEAQSVVAGSLDVDGNLILTTHGGTDIPVGVVQTPVSDATTSTSGVVELATSAETIAGTDAVRAVTAAGLAAKDAATVLDPTAFTDTTLMASYPVGMSTLSFTTGQATTAAWGFGSKAGTIRTYNRPASAGISQIFNRTHASATTPEMWFRGGDGSGWGTWQQAAPTSLVATTSVSGLVELATTAETQTGTDTARAVTPAGLAGTVATTSQKGVIQLATTAEVTTGTDTAKAATAAGVAAAITASATPSASTTAQGKIEIATVGEGYVGTDTVRAVTPAGLAAMHGTGIYVPAGWGSFWRTKRDAHASGKAIIAAVGSSSAQGLYCGNLLTDSFVSKLRVQLQSQYSSGGSGFFSSTRSLTFLGASTLTNAWNAISGNLATMSGTWLGGSNFGPAGQYMYTGDAGGYIQFAKVNGTTIRIYTMSGGGRANWQYQIDGGSIVSITDSGTPSIQVTTITGLSAGDHTVKLIQNASATVNFSPCGVTGENATGIIVNNFGLSGGTSAIFAPAANDIYQPTTWNGGPDYPCDLLIYNLGANDANSGVAIDTYTANVRKFLSAVRDGTAAGGGLATGNTDILLLMQHIGKYDNATPKWQDYCDRMRGIAEAYGAAMVNAWPIGRNSWNYWNSSGNWGTSGSTGGVSGTDSIHMSNAGHTAVYNAILPLLTA